MKWGTWSAILPLSCQYQAESKFNVIDLQIVTKLSVFEMVYTIDLSGGGCDFFHTPSISAREWYSKP